MNNSITKIIGTSWFLENCARLAARNANSFYIPSRADLDKIVIGDHVKLIFAKYDKNHTTERMWVEVTRITDESLHGLLNNTPAVTHDLRFGDLINFNLFNVANIIPNWL